ncbi:MAG: hypothetical protein F2534_21415 [Actinobacteria bacterium]|uniref:Unannotated protein n=1 Tax=freshwater metagenome TaxID=449393 RepID=A0A6J6GB20_9ZZZZ|nr:hypothetical protein [Actinomycetota bacterium]
MPCTTAKRGWLSEVDVAEFGVAQAHLPTTISVDRFVEPTGANVGPAALLQIRELIADLLGLRPEPRDDVTVALDGSSAWVTADDRGGGLPLGASSGTSAR